MSIDTSEQKNITVTPNESGLINGFMDLGRAWTQPGEMVDWNRLMPVVEKIDALYSKAFPPGDEFIRMILMHENPIDPKYTDVIALPLSTKIQEAYKAVIEFIKWYNGLAIDKSTLKQ